MECRTRVFKEGGRRGRSVERPISRGLTLLCSSLVVIRDVGVLAPSHKSYPSQERAMV